MSRIISIGFLIVIVAGAALTWQAYRFVRTPAGDDAAVVVFEVRSGHRMRDVAKGLQEFELITDAQKFRAYAKLKSLDHQIKAGEYALRRNMTPRQILSVLASGKSIEYVVTISEGLNRFEIASLVERAGIGSKDEFLKLTQDRKYIVDVLGEPVSTLEGYLFPETYYVTRAAGVRGLVRQMLSKFKEQFARVQLEEGAAVQMSKHQLITLASIVEKETGAPEERPVVSSVFHNRLKKKMRLQTDPTVIYGIWSQSGQWNRNISKQDLQTYTPYNTYVIEGLPQGPIANPGFLALQAAARPAQSEYLFFVSRNDGTHVFSKEYKQHRSAVVEFQLDRKSREGKSWRDLNKRKSEEK